VLDPNRPAVVQSTEACAEPTRAPLTLDVIIPTLNRAPLLERALRSLLTARIPPGLEARIIVVNNGSTDQTGDLLSRLQSAHPGRLRVVDERRRGKSRALNAGIAVASGDLVGMIDDDEEIADWWFEEVCRAFQDPSLDFAGGPYVAAWSSPPPGWIPPDYLAVLGAVDNGREPRPYDREFPGILKGGNAVIRRDVLQRAGAYAEHLGPTGEARLLSCEDEEMYQRLLEMGARGLYLPSLVILHHVAPERLSPAYYRRWCFWRGVSRGLMDRAHPLPVSYLAGIPRFLYGRAARGWFRLARVAARGAPLTQTLNDELAIWDLAGYGWGRHIYTLVRFSPLRSRRDGFQDPVPKH
jgi:glycosyltransferase involved in cell wall biosynthesis